MWLKLYCLFLVTDMSIEVWNNIIEALLIVLSRYHDLKSQSYVKEFVKILMTSQPEASLLNLSPVLAEYVKNFPRFNIS